MQATIQEWRKKLATISQNVMELSNNPKLQRIKHRAKDTIHPYKGVTLEKSELLLSLIDKLWQDYLLLTEVVDQATTLLAEDSFFHDTDNAVQELLEGSSIKLPAIHVPITQRTLLTSSTISESVSPKSLMLFMEESFAKAQETFKLIIEAEDTIGMRSSAISKELAAIKKLAAALNSEINVTIDVTIQNSEFDPVGCFVDFNHIDKVLNAERERLRSIENEIKAVQASLEHCTTMLVELKGIMERTKAVIEETQLKIAHPHYIPSLLQDEIIGFLEKWWNTLLSTLKSGKWESARVGIFRWQNHCNEHLTKAKDIYAKSRSDLDERDSLRSQFKAVKALFESFATTNFTPSPTLEKMELDVAQVLKERPFRVDIGQKLVTTYETLLMAEINHYRRKSQ